MKKGFLKKPNPKKNKRGKAKKKGGDDEAAHSGTAPSSALSMAAASSGGRMSELAKLQAEMRAATEGLRRAREEAEAARLTVEAAQADLNEAEACAKGAEDKVNEQQKGFAEQVQQEAAGAAAATAAANTNNTGTGDVSAPKKTAASGPPSASSAGTADTAHPPQYGQQTYWEQRYRDEGDAAVFEWYQGYKELRPHLDRLLPDRSAAILDSGCGNSAFGRDMCVDGGYSRLTCVDYSPSVIAGLKQRYPEVDPAMFRVMDATDLQYPDFTFDAIIDKGTLDAVMGGDLGGGAPAAAVPPGTGTEAGREAAQGGLSNATAILDEAKRVLVPGGKLLIISSVPPAVYGPFLLPGGEGEPSHEAKLANTPAAGAAPAGEDGEEEGGGEAPSTAAAGWANLRHTKMDSDASIGGARDGRKLEIYLYELTKAELPETSILAQYDPTLPRDQHLRTRVELEPTLGDDGKTLEVAFTVFGGRAGKGRGRSVSSERDFVAVWKDGIRSYGKGGVTDHDAFEWVEEGVHSGRVTLTLKGDWLRAAAAATGLPKLTVGYVKSEVMKADGIIGTATVSAPPLAAEAKTPPSAMPAAGTAPPPMPQTDVFELDD